MKEDVPLIPTKPALLQSYVLCKEHGGSVGTSVLEKALVLIPTQPFLEQDPPLDLAGSSIAQGESLEGRGQEFLPFLGTVSAASQLYLMASSTQVCRGTGGEWMPAGSSER